MALIVRRNLARVINANLKVVLPDSILDPLGEILVSRVDPAPDEVLEKLLDVEGEWDTEVQSIKTYAQQDTGHKTHPGKASA